MGDKRFSTCEGPWYGNINTKLFWQYLQLLITNVYHSKWFSKGPHHIAYHHWMLVELHVLILASISPLATIIGLPWCRGHENYQDKKNLNPNKNKGRFNSKSWNKKNKNKKTTHVNNNLIRFYCK
jgi:hypothetical protein